ncbi:MAG: SUMF1/EgtB/PvdO family nonheme iron enzyme [Acidobacteriota bacterium]
MKRWLHSRLKPGVVLTFVAGFSLCLMVVYFSHTALEYTSTDAYCRSCHVHPQATRSWKAGPHHKTGSGVVAHCVDCHLPPQGLPHYVEKFKAGGRDLYGYYFKDVSKIDWDALSTHDYAVHYTFDTACLHCHVNLFPVGLSNKAVDAHLHYNQNREDLRCINCHLYTGHHHEQLQPQVLEAAAKAARPPDVEKAPLISQLQPGAFVDYSEVIPNSGVTFEMVAIEGGTFLMGSPEDEPDRESVESPQREVRISPFWMGRAEVSWDEYLAFYSQTATRGRNESGERTDAITGPTPPYGSPDQGWGKGSLPAITMTHYAARKYCQWLSAVTGRRYRLPTEAEWEYACRAGTTGPYFFAPRSQRSWIGRWWGGSDHEGLGSYAWFLDNGRARTHPPYSKAANPWGLRNMIGNVREFCLDRYDSRAYNASAPVVVDPRGPASGLEHVVRGGSFKSPARSLRSAARDHTQHEAWLKTDPQAPKSVWWYSDVVDVGFRVVREYDPSASGSSHNRKGDHHEERKREEGTGDKS